MAASGNNNQVVSYFARIITEMIESVTDEQKKVLFDTILSGLQTPYTPIASPAGNMAVTSSPAQAATPAGAARRRLQRSRRVERKKGVNAFMVFRAFYSPLLVGLTQKERSPILSKMWRTEQRQSLFALLGVAFSKIRDDNLAPGVTLDKFLRVAANAVGVIPVEEYFAKSGWTIIDQALKASPVDTAAVLDEYPPVTNLSPDDLVSICHEQGLISGSPGQDMDGDVNESGATGNMAFVAPNQLAENSIPSPDSSITVSDLEFVDNEAYLDNTWAAFMPHTVVEADLRLDYNPSLSSVSAEQQRIYEQTPAFAHWHPAIEPPLLQFDPNTIQDDFDPFNFDFDGFPALEFDGFPNFEL